MPDYNWPPKEKRAHIGKRYTRLDGPVKVSGRAKYTYDVKRPGMLFGKVLHSPHAHAKIVSIDTIAAEKMPGVMAVKVLQKPGTEIHWAYDDIAAVAAVDEPTARDAIRAIKVEYEVLPHFVSEAEPPRNLAVSEGPVSDDDLFGMLENQVPVEQIVAQIQKHGMSWKVDADTMSKLPQWGVPAPVVQAIKTAKYVEAAPSAASPYKKQAAQVSGEPEAAFKEAAAVSEGLYGLAQIAHCCLEPHGGMSEWEDPQRLLVHISTQNVSGIAGQMAEPLGIPAANIHVKQEHIGGGFGSKFGPDRWGVATAELSKLAGGKPVKIMLERDAELMVAGARPSAYARVKVAAAKDGTLTAWESRSWASGGVGGGGMPPIPYIFNIKNQRKQHTAVATNVGGARAWRAPAHPQACLITMGALDDLAAKLNMDPVELLLKNIDLTGPRAQIYREELPIAMELMDWKKKWHPRGQGGGTGPVKRGVGVAVHTWGGRGHASNCDLTIHPDGAVDVKLGSQDLGTGTRTAIAMVAADSLGLPLNAVNVLIGDTAYPQSGGSGGSTTIGGVSASTRRAAVNALELLFAKVAPALNAQPAELEAVGGRVQVKGAPSRGMSWKDAAAKMGAVPLTARGANVGGPPDPAQGKLIDSGVGGVIMADVAVDTETGIVKMVQSVCVQDCGTIISLKTAESQVYGALIMGIAYSLYEEKVHDPVTGRMLNPNMEFYKLANIGDVGELVVHMMTTDFHDQRGVIGLGEPPVVGPGAAIANAVANATGVRVPMLPLTPDRVLAALEQKGGRA